MTKGELVKPKPNASVEVTATGIRIQGQFDGYEMAEMMLALRQVQSRQSRQSFGTEMLGAAGEMICKVGPLLWLFPLLLAVLVGFNLFKGVGVSQEQYRGASIGVNDHV